MTKNAQREADRAAIESFLAKGGEVKICEPARKNKNTQLNKHMGKA